MKNLKHASTLMSTLIKLNKDEQGYMVDQKLYRPDIMYSVCTCARFQSSPRASHLMTVKRIIRYVNGTIEI